MKLLSSSCTAALLLVSAGTAHADTIDDEIVVTGQYLYSDQVNALKTPTPIIDVPQSLSIFTADQISQRGFTNIGQIIDYTPGVNTSQGEGHRDAVVFRGVRSTADFFIDGVRDDVQYYRPLYNLEQVEILRGPNALLFGRGGTGGILNRVTKKGVIGDSFTGYQAAIDTFGAFDVQLDSNFAVNDSAALRVNAMYESLNNHRDFYDGERIGLNPTARFEINPQTILDLSYEYVDHERFIDRGIPTDGQTPGRPVEALKDIVFGDPEVNITKLEAHILRANLTREFSDSLKGIFSASYADYDKLYDNFYASAYDLATNNVELDGYIDTTQRKNFTLSANLIGEFETGGIEHTIVTGAEFLDTANNNDRFNPVFSTTGDDRENFVATRPLNFSGLSGVNFDGVNVIAAFTDLNDDTEADLQVFSAYIQDEIALSPNFDIIIGGRFDSFDISVDDIANGGNTSRKDEEFSPRLGVVFKPQENVSLYGSYSESFIPSSGEQFASLGATNAALAPDTFENLEAGVKWDFTDNLSFTAAVFQIDSSLPEVDDDPVTNPTGDTSIQKRIEGEVKGFEIQLQGQLTDAWFISAGYSYLDGEQASEAGDGNRLRELPENMFSIWNNYQITDQFGLGLGFTYQDESFINNGNTAILPSYTRFDAAAYYDVREDLRLQVNIENLTDELYFPNSHSTHQATVGAPLHARFTVSGRF